MGSGIFKRPRPEPEEDGEGSSDAKRILAMIKRLEEDVEAWRSPSAVARRAGRMETPGRARDGRDAAALRDDDAAEVSRASDAACMALVFTGTRLRA